MPLSTLILFSKLISSLMSVLLAPGPLMNCSILHMIYVPIRKETPVVKYSSVTTGYHFPKCKRILHTYHMISQELSAFGRIGSFGHATQQW